MSRLKVFLLGSVYLEVDGQSIHLDRHKSIALLIYLLHERHPHDRNSLAALLWPELDQARARAGLRRALATINKALKLTCIEANRQTLAIVSNAPVWVDGHQFQSLIASAITHKPTPSYVSHQCAELLHQACALWKNSFMQGFSLSDAPDFDRWQMEQAEQYQDKLMTAYDYLLTYYKSRQDWDQALFIARQSLQIDPLYEKGHQEIMRLQAQKGNFSKAIQQFESFADCLQTEIGVTPQEETLSIYKRLQAGSMPLTILPQESINAKPNIYHFNLPTRTTPFVGRKEELTQVANSLANPNCQLLTLIGLGGIGKTALAIEVARREKNNFRNGVCFVSFDAVESASMVATTIADALGIMFYGAALPQEQLLDYLREKQLLLILDNFEHLLEAAPDIAQLIAAANQVKALITSRERLNLQEEWLFTVYGLAYPPPISISETEDISQFSAVQLFLESACRVAPHFELSPYTSNCILTICQILEGMPLGIQLAASWLRIMPCHEIVREINANLDFLSNTWRNIPERQQSLRAVFEYSWQYLEKEEKVVFCKLGVFHGSFDRNAALTVTETNIIRLTSLVDKSFLYVDDRGRYKAHQLLRRFMLEKLDADPDIKLSTNQTHCHYYAHLAQRAVGELFTVEQKVALQTIVCELDNIRASWEWACQEQDAEAISALLEAIFQVYRLQSWFSEGVAKLTAAALAFDHPQHRILYGRILARQAVFIYQLGQYQEAKVLHQQCLDIFNAPEKALDRAFSLDYLGVIAARIAQYDQAETYHQQAWEIFKTQGHPYGMAKSLNGLGIIARMRGEYEQAIDYYQQSLHLSRQNCTLHEVAHTLINLGNTVVAIASQYRDAKPIFTEALSVLESLGNKRGVSIALNNLGNLAEAEGNYDEARQLYQRSLAIKKEIGNQRGLIYPLNNLGHVYLALEDYEAGKLLFEESLIVAQDIQYQTGVIFSLIGLGEAELRLQLQEKALANFNKAASLAESTQNIPFMWEAKVGLATALMADGKEVAAQELARTILQAPQATQKTHERAQLLLLA